MDMPIVVQTADGDAANFNCDCELPPRRDMSDYRQPGLALSLKRQNSVTATRAPTPYWPDKSWPPATSRYKRRSVPWKYGVSSIEVAASQSFT